MSQQKDVTIYTTPTCHFCHAAKEFFKENGIAYTEHDVSTNMEKRKEMIEKSKQMGVPVIFIGDDMAIGFDESHIRRLLNL